MNLATLKNVVTSKVGRQLLTAQKHSPTLLFGAGIVGVVGTVVLASRATLKVETVLMDHQSTLDKIKNTEHVDYDEDDRKKDTVVLYINTVGKLAKLYSPAIFLGVVAVTCLTSSHRILSQRNAGLMAAYTALDKGFRAYRERVVADLGEDKDREYRYGAEDRPVVKESKNGSKTTTMEKVCAADGPSIYAKLFDRDTSQSWSPQPEYNFMFLKSQQNFMNDLLQARGHVFLNEVYDGLGLPHTKEGALVGWVKGNGDDYVDFNLFNREMMPVHADFFSGREDGIWLDFNVDGVVWDKI